MTELDLTPHEPGGSEPKGGRSASVRNIAIMGIIGLVLVFVLYQAISSARVFFLNVDEAVAQQADLGTQTFRMQGTVVSESGVDDVGALVFVVAFDDAKAEVRHTGDEPSNLFGIGEKVVVQGHWEGDVFQSHQIVIKHSEEYIEDNPDRLDYELDPATGLE